MSSPTTSPPDPVAGGSGLRRRWWPALAVALGVVLVIGVDGVTLLGGAASDPGPATMQNQATRVMPFDLAATTHEFLQAPDGGVEQITANSPGDVANISSIRGHLAREAAAVSAGDYSDPAAIHGGDMPGLAELEAGAGRVEVAYSEVPGGARVTLRSTDPALVDAVHAWFTAQAGDHAMPGMGMGQ